MSTVAGLQIPVIPLDDVLINAGTLPPAQIVRPVPKGNVGVIFGLTVTVKVVGSAQILAAGVNVYVPLAWLSTVAGLHVPFIPFTEVPGNVGTVPPAQIVSVVPKLKVGVIFGVTVMVKVVGVAHSPAAGVKV